MLVPSIDRLLSSAAWRKEELDCLVTGVGPGSFTGIRTGLVTARTLAHALKLPLVGVSRFECFARAVELPAGIILSCGPGLYFAAAYACGSRGKLTAILDPAYLPAADLGQALALTERWLAEPAALAELKAAGQEVGKAFKLDALPALKNIAEQQAQIAWDRLSFKVPGCPDPASLAAAEDEYHWSKIEPLYLRGPSVTLKR